MARSLTIEGVSKPAIQPRKSNDHNTRATSGEYMKNQLKHCIIGLVGVLAISWASIASAWTSDSDQRGWVDSIIWHTGAVFGPTPQVEITGWACLNPKYNTAVNPTNVQIYQGNKQLTIVTTSIQNRPDTVSVGACANTNSGFYVGAVGADLSLPNNFTVIFFGGFSPIVLEGVTVSTIRTSG
jgi:hypothetical protein